MLVVLSTLEKAINSYIQLDEASKNNLEMLSGKVLKLTLSGLDCTFFMVFSEKEIFLQTDCSGQPDLEIAGPPLVLLRLFSDGENSDALFSDEIKISGDLVFAQRMKTFFAGIKIDWTYYWSKIVGDVAANETERFLLGNMERAKSLVSRLRGNMVEYVQEEAELLPSKNLAEDFFSSVDRFRDDVARLDQRIARLMKKAKEA